MGINRKNAVIVGILYIIGTVAGVFSVSAAARLALYDRHPRAISTPSSPSDRIGDRVPFLLTHERRWIPAKYTRG